MSIDASGRYNDYKPGSANYRRSEAYNLNPANPSSRKGNLAPGNNSTGSDSSTTTSLRGQGRDTLTIIDQDTGEVVQQGTKNTNNFTSGSGGINPSTGLPSITPPTTKQTNNFYTNNPPKQPITNKPSLTQELTQGFGQAHTTKSTPLQTTTKSTTPQTMSNINPLQYKKTNYLTPKPTFITPRQAITQGTILAEYAKTLQGKKLTPKQHDPFAVLEKKALSKKLGLTQQQKKYESQSQAINYLDSIITKLDNKLNSRVTSFTKQYLGKKLPPKEYKKAQKELAQIKLIEKELNTQTKLQQNLFTKTTNTYDELKNKINSFNQEYTKKLEQRHYTKKILPDTPKKPVELDTISGGIPLSRQLGINSMKNIRKQDIKFIKEYEQSDQPLIGSPRAQNLGRLQAKDIGMSRKLLGKNLLLAAEASLYLFPVTSILSGAIKGTRIANILSKTKTIKKAKKVLTPKITYTKYSPIKETRIVQEGKQYIIGKGKILYTQTGKIASKFGVKPSNKFLTVNYKANINELWKTPGKLGSKTPRGTPQSLVNLIPEENLIKLFTSQKTSTKALKGLTTYESKGIIQLQAPGKTLKEYKIVSDSSTGFPRNVRVWTSPTDIFRLKGTTTTGQFKLSTTGEQLTGGKISFIDYSDKITRATSKLRVKKGAKFNIISTTTKGKVKDAFAVPKLTRFKTIKQVTKADKARTAIKILKQKGQAVPPEVTKASQGYFVKYPKKIIPKIRILNGKTTQTITKTSTKIMPKTSTKTLVGTKTPIVSSVQTATKKYLDVYGFQSYQRLTRNLVRSALITTTSLTRLSQIPITTHTKTQRKPLTLTSTKTMTPTTTFTPTTTLTPTKTLTPITTLTPTKTFTPTKTLTPIKTMTPHPPIITPKIPMIPLIGTKPIGNKTDNSNTHKKNNKKYELTNITNLNRFWKKKKKNRLF